MKKVICDFCLQEITDDNRFDGEKFKLTTKLWPSNGMRSGLSIEVVALKTEDWFNVDCCKYCIIDAIKSLDGRAKQ